MSFPPELDSTQTELSRLRIHHLLAGTAVASLFLAVIKGLTQGSQLDAISGTSTLVLNIPFTSLAVCCLAFGLHWYWKGREFFHQPGHGLLIILSISFLFQIIYLLGFSFVYEVDEQGNLYSVASSESILNWLLTNGWYFVCLLICVINIWLAKRFKPVRRWNLFFKFNAAVTIIQGLWMYALNEFSMSTNAFWFWFYPLVWLGSEVAMSIFLMLIAVRDFKEKLPYHWSHWVGVFCTIIIWLWSVLVLLWSFMNPTYWSAYPTG